MTKNEQNEPELLATVSKALQLLSVVGSSKTELGISELSRQLGFSKAVTHRLVTTCARHRYLYQNGQSKHYGIGPEAFRVGIRFYPSYNLSYMMREPLRTIAREVGHTTYVGIIDDTNVLVIAAFEGSSPVRVESTKRGDVLPIHSTALGGALLASIPANEQREILRRALSKTSPVKNAELNKYIDNLEGVRAQGYAVGENGGAKDVTSIAVSIDARLQGIPIALCISVPSAILDKTPTEDLVRVVKSAAAKVGQALSQDHRM